MLSELRIAFPVRLEYVVKISPDWTLWEDLQTDLRWMLFILDLHFALSRAKRFTLHTSYVQVKFGNTIKSYRYFDNSGW